MIHKSYINCPSISFPDGVSCHQDAAENHTLPGLEDVLHGNGEVLGQGGFPQESSSVKLDGFNPSNGFHVLVYTKPCTVLITLFGDN